MFEKNLLLPYLLDIYGSLLSDRKRELLDYYYGEDYSLSEISELTGISRQGVRDSIKKSEAELLGFEDKLRLFEKRKDAESLIKEAKSLAEGNTALTAVLDALEEAAT
ncbi:MAG: DNA-binding protein [Clostridia bacterium]|nr:DNA-binding protein [Clostridia bacterium]